MAVFEGGGSGGGGGGGGGLPNNVGPTYYISPRGNDATADGSFYKPFLTFVGMNTFFNALASQPSNTQPFVVIVEPNTYAETSSALIYPNCIYQGSDPNKCVISPNNSLGLSLYAGASSAFMNNTTFVGFYGLGLPFGFNVDLATLGGSGINTLNFDNCILGAYIYTARANDIIAGINQTNFTSTASFSDAVSNFMFGCTFANLVTFTTVNTGTSAIIIGSNIASRFTISNPINKGTTTVLFAGCSIKESAGGLTIGANCVLTSDIVSLPTLSSAVVNSGTIALTSNSFYGLYTPTTSGDWPVQPLNIGDALDKLASGWLNKSGGTMTGNLILNGNPTVGNQAATKSYADSIAAGIAIKQACVCATTGNLTATYSNGTAGVGATLTNSSTQAAFSADGVSPTVGQRVLVKSQTTTFQNGIYTVTTVGSGSTNWVLTRATDFDQVAEINASSVVVTGGTTLANSFWIQDVTIATVGTDAIVFAQVNFSSGTYLTIANNLSDLANKTTARANLGVAIGADVQAFSAALTNIIAQNTGGILVNTSGTAYALRTVTGTSGTITVTNGNGVSGNPTLTIDSGYVGQSTITTLGTIATGTWHGTVVAPQYGGTGRNNGNNTIDLTAGGAFTMTGGGFPITFNVTASSIITISGTGTMLTSGNGLQQANNLSDVSSASTSRTNLGLGSAAVLNTNQILESSNNLSDLNNVATARTNLGVGSGSDVTFSSITIKDPSNPSNGAVDFYTAEETFTNQSYQLPTAYPVDTTYALTSDGSGTMQWSKFTQGGPTTYKVTVIASTGSTTFTRDSGTVFATVKLLGAAGGGGGTNIASTTLVGGAGGGAGEYVEKTFTAAALGATQTVTIGTGGAAGLIESSTNSASNGANGGNSTFGSLLTAHGGSGAGVGIYGASGFGACPGAGGTGSVGGDINITGNPGAYPAFVNPASLYSGSIGGNGGSSVFGVGGTGATLTTSGSNVNATAAGVGGGGGGSNIGTAGTTHGTAGGNGQCYIIEYIAS